MISLYIQFIFNFKLFMNMILGLNEIMCLNLLCKHKIISCY